MYVLNIWHWLTFRTYVCIFVERKIKKRKKFWVSFELYGSGQHILSPATISRNSNLSSIFIGPSCSYRISIFWSINGGSTILLGETFLGWNHLRAGTANQTKINCVFSSLQIVFYGPPFLSQFCFPFQSLHIAYLVLGCSLYPYGSFFFVPEVQYHSLFPSFLIPLY